MQFVNISSSLEVMDLRESQIDLSTIQNRRFMYHSDGILILGAEDVTKRTRGVLKSHAEEHGEAIAHTNSKLPPYDEFVRGWIGVGKHYPDGIIHFAPHIPSSCGPYFDTAFDFIETALKNGFNSKSVLRGFGEVWEQEISCILGESAICHKKPSLDKQIESTKARVSANYFLEDKQNSLDQEL